MCQNKNRLLFSVVILSSSLLVACTNRGDDDAVAVRATTTSAASWSGVKLLGTIGGEEGHGIATDASGNVYVVGYTTGDLDGNSNAGGADAFLVKYSASGDKRWTRQLGTPAHDYGFAVATDSGGNVFVVGETYGALDGHTSAGSADSFVTKFDTNGTKRWTRQFGTGAHDAGKGVACDGTGNVYVTGFTRGGLDGNTHSGGSDVFVVKYDAQGARQWTQQFGTTGHDESHGVAIDASGNVFLAGHTDGGLDGNPNAGSTDMFIAKLNSGGARQWTRQLGTSVGDYAWAIAVDIGGNAYATGYTLGDLDGNTSAGGSDVFVVKYDNLGARQWTRQLGTAGAALPDVAYGIATNASGDVYVTGFTEGNLDGGTPIGHKDIFAAKYDTHGTRQWARQLGALTVSEGRGVATDATGGVMVTGYTTDGLGGNVSAGGSDVFVASFDSAGVRR